MKAGAIEISYVLAIHWVHGGDPERYSITRHALATLLSTGTLPLSVPTGTPKGPLHVNVRHVRMWRGFKRSYRYTEKADYISGYGEVPGKWYPGYKEITYEPWGDSDTPADPLPPEPTTDNPLSLDAHYDDCLNCLSDWRDTMPTTTCPTPDRNSRPPQSLADFQQTLASNADAARRLQELALMLPLGYGTGDTYHKAIMEAARRLRNLREAVEAEDAAEAAYNNHIRLLNEERELLNNLGLTANLYRNDSQ